MEQCQNESVLEFVHRINRHFHGNSSRWYTKTKRECLISGLKQEIAVKLRDDVRDGDPSLTWEQTVDAAEDAESLVYLIKRQQPTFSNDLIGQPIFRIFSPFTAFLYLPNFPIGILSKVRNHYNRQ